MRTRAYALVVLALAAIPFPGCESPPPQAIPTSPAAEAGPMVRRLALLRADAQPLRDPFLNAARVRALETRELPLAPKEAGNLRMRLGLERLRAGQTRRAIEDFRKVRQASRAGQLPEEFGPMASEWLAVAHLRRAEEENCVAHHTSDSCLLPIRGNGVHERREHTLAAIEELQLLLAADPTNLDLRWLLNLASMAAGEYPHSLSEELRIPPSALRSEAAFPRFRDEAPTLGLAASGLAGSSLVDDFTGDRRLDVFVSSWGLGGSLRLFVQRQDGSFEERTDEAGLSELGGALGLVHADYDNDGDRDVLALRGAWRGSQGNLPNSLLRNNGAGVFEDVTDEAGLLSFHPTQTAVATDLDRDGYVDFVIGNESSPGEHHPSEFFHNQGNGKFRERAAEAGLTLGGFVKGIAAGDIDDDGWPDLYVSRMRAPNLLLRNGGTEPGQVPRFEDITSAAGVGEPENSFPTWFFDFDQDGDLDIFVAGYGAGFEELATFSIAAEYLGGNRAGETPRLYRNEGDLQFRDVTEVVGLDRTAFVMGANHGDLDNDGWPDLYLGTGAPDFRALMPNRMFRNDTGSRFQDVTTAGGFGHLQKGHGISFADLDDDGDQDVCAEMGGAYEADAYPNALFRNPGNENSWVTLRLVGNSSNRDAIGARIRVSTRGPGKGREIYTWVDSGGSFGGNSLQQEIGLGTASAIEEVEVRWPDGSPPERWTAIPIRRTLTLRQGEGEPVLSRR